MIALGHGGIDGIQAVHLSLTGHLRDAGSPIRAYVDRISPVLSDVSEGPQRARAAAGALGLLDIARSKTLVPLVPGVDAARAGTAIDFRTRMALGGFNVHESAAALGVAQLPLYEHLVENGCHRARILTEAFDVAVRLIGDPADETDLDRAAILLAHCEQIHRAGSEVLKGSVGPVLDSATDGQEFADAIDAPSLADIRSLVWSSTAQLEDWREQIARGERSEPNPQFSGAELVGGADADWLMGGTLIDCKAYAHLTVSKLRDFLRQVLAYVMLDLDDSMSIRAVGVWLPRQGVLSTWGLDRLLGGDPDELLPVLRQGFCTAATGQQLSVRVPVTRRRQHQVLADNKHTPRWMLKELARSEDQDIRFRIGRNAITPEETVRELARDRYAKVREGVARNELVPVDVLEALSGDSSVLVRRAVAANPRAPRTSRRPAIETARTDDAARIRHASKSAVGRIEQVRNDDKSADWLYRFLVLTLGGPDIWGQGLCIPLPFASIVSATILGWSTVMPDWLTAGLPDEVTDYLMRDGHPAWMRRIVADYRSIADPAVLAGLLADTDPQIRWAALQRTLHAPDDALGPLLGELAASRDARLRFRMEGDNRAARGHSRSEYDTTTLKLIAAHPSTPLSMLRELMRADSSEILVPLICNPSLAAEDLASLLPRLRSMRSAEARQQLAASSRIPTTVAEMLTNDQDAWVRTALATNEAAPVEVLFLLAGDPEQSVRLAVLENAATPDDLAADIAESLLTSSTGEQLHVVVHAVERRHGIELPEGLLEHAIDELSKSRQRDPDMRLFAARSKHAGAKTLARLAKSADQVVRTAVANNARTPSKALEELAADPASPVREAAARNEALGMRWLSALAHDHEPNVRASAARSHRLDPALLGDLLLDDDPEVQSAALTNPATRSEDRRRFERPKKRAFENPRLTQADLIESITSNRAEVRVRTARDPRTPPDALVMLGGERRSVEVRRTVAANPNTPPDVLASLAEDKDAQVRQAVAFNVATPPEVLAELADRGIDLAIIVTLNLGAPLEILDTLTKDIDPLVRHIASCSRAARAASAAKAKLITRSSGSDDVPMIEA